jgi:gamma-glutamylcyclotransferase (GGCT)/AIG2-like uncharacterized protein YtfP
LLICRVQAQFYDVGLSYPHFGWRVLASEAVCTINRRVAVSAEFYFAYGSNLNRDDWSQSCEEKGYQPEPLSIRSIGYLPDHDIRFSRRSKTRNGGVLDIVRRIGQIVPGVIFQVTDGDWDRLDEKEGAPSVYERIETTAIDQSGQEVAVETYRVTEPKQFIEPSPKYLSVVRDGLESYGLATNALESAALNEPTNPLVDAFFVYGTLMRREIRFSALQEHGVRCTLLATAAGRLIDLGEYPGLIEMGSTDSAAHGDFVRVADPEKAVAALDVIEGFNGFDQPDSLYRRTLCQVDVGEGRMRQAWIYCLAAPAERPRFIPSGDWREHQGKRQRFLAELTDAHARGNEMGAALGIAKGLPFSFNPDAEAVARSLLPLNAALNTGAISERLLAQQSGIWNALA